MPYRRRSYRRRPVRRPRRRVPMTRSTALAPRNRGIRQTGMAFNTVGRAGVITPYLVGYPSTRTACLRFNTVLNFDLSSGIGQGVHLYRANSIFDPDQSLGGTTALGYTQWNAFYNHYLVYRSRIKIEATGSDNSATGAVIVWCALQDSDTTTPTTVPMILAQPYCSHKVLNGFAGIGKASIFNRFDARAFFSARNVRDQQVRLGAAFGQNPSEDAMFSIGVQTMSGTAVGNCKISVLVSIEYDTLFTEPNPMTN